LEPHALHSTRFDLSSSRKKAVPVNTLTLPWFFRPAVIALLIAVSCAGSSKADQTIEPTADALRSAVLQGGRITFKSNGVITLTNNISIQHDTVIDAGNLSVTIDGQNLCQLFSIQGSDVTLVGLNLINAAANGVSAVVAIIDSECVALTNAQPGFGAAIYVSNATVRLDSCTLSNAVARGGDGSSDCGIVALAAGAFGGSVYSVDASLIISNSLFLNCTATTGTNPDSSQPRGPVAGGAIFARDSRLTLSDSKFIGNRAENGGSYYGLNTGLGGAICLSNSVASISNSLPFPPFFGPSLVESVLSMLVVGFFKFHR
jgi:hypothetical protein